MRFWRGKALYLVLLLSSALFCSGTGIDDWRKDAEQGRAFAQYYLGLMYDDGEGVAEDNVEAVKWYRKAAEQGYSFAQFKLGQMYAMGKGVAQDYVEAVKWYRNAAEQGHWDAQKN
jgi:TPR repeat protein